MFFLLNILRWVPAIGAPVLSCSDFFEGSKIARSAKFRVFPKIMGKPPKWMVKIMVPNPIQTWDDLGGFTTPIFGGPPISESHGT